MEQLYPCSTTTEHVPNKKSHCDEKPSDCTKDPCSPQLETAHSST